MNKRLKRRATEIGRIEVVRLDSEVLAYLHRTFLAHVVDKEGVDITQGHAGFAEGLAGRASDHRKLGLVPNLAKRRLRNTGDVSGRFLE